MCEKASELLKRCEAHPESMTILDSSYLRAAAAVLRGEENVCYGCGGRVLARARARARLLGAELPGGRHTFVATFCGRCRDRMDRDARYEAAIMARLEAHAQSLRSLGTGDIPVVAGSA